MNLAEHPTVRRFHQSHGHGAGRSGLGRIGLGGEQEQQDQQVAGDAQDDGERAASLDDLAARPHGEARRPRLHGVLGGLAHARRPVRWAFRARW